MNRPGPRSIVRSCAITEAAEVLGKATICQSYMIRCRKAWQAHGGQLPGVKQVAERREKLAERAETCVHDMCAEHWIRTGAGAIVTAMSRKYRCANHCLCSTDLDVYVLRHAHPSRPLAELLIEVRKNNAIPNIILLDFLRRLRTPLFTERDRLDPRSQILLRSQLEHRLHLRPVADMRAANVAAIRSEVLGHDLQSLVNTAAPGLMAVLLEDSIIPAAAAYPEDRTCGSVP